MSLFGKKTPKKIVNPAELDAIEKLAQYKIQHENDRDVLEIYDDKMRETQQSFFNKPPSSHYSSRNDMTDIPHQSFYDGSGRYSNKTYDLVNLYLSQKPAYDSRRFDYFDRPENDNKYSQMNQMGMNTGLSSMLQNSNYLSTPSQSLSKSQSMTELNERIKNTINGSKRAYMM